MLHRQLAGTRFSLSKRHKSHYKKYGYHFCNICHIWHQIHSIKSLRDRHIARAMRVARGVLKKQGLVTVIFHNKDSASAAFERLVRVGYEPAQIVVVMTQETYQHHYAGKADLFTNGDGRANYSLTRYLNKAGTSKEVPSIGVVVAGPFSTDPALNNGPENTRHLLVTTGIEPDRAIIYEPELRAGGVLIGVMPKGPTDRYTIGNSWRKSEGELILGDDEDF
jgi:hypothetical protein